jgi:hypothetical protein
MAESTEFEIFSYTGTLNRHCLTLEHSETYRIYKRIFKESEFSEYLSMEALNGC